MGKPEAPGPVAFVIGGDPEKKIVIFQFGHAITRLEFSPEEALEIASNIMSRASIASGMSLEALVARRDALVKASGKIVGTPLTPERIAELERENAGEPPRVTELTADGKQSPPGYGPGVDPNYEMPEG
ncbi:MAG: hypothetical protein OEW15_18775 [Nitrospirota bacterium]|nr:hypothetical protein [Nitrospirota bacterium]